MFIDSRNGSTNGKNLVICTEGNSGFYEIGIMQGPIDKGFSVLGWNHPGFAHSTVSMFSQWGRFTTFKRPLKVPRLTYIRILITMALMPLLGDYSQSKN